MQREHSTHSPTDFFKLRWVKPIADATNGGKSRLMCRTSEVKHT